MTDEDNISIPFHQIMQWFNATSQAIGHIEGKRHRKDFGIDQSVSQFLKMRDEINDLIKDALKNQCKCRCKCGANKGQVYQEKN